MARKLKWHEVKSSAIRKVAYEDGALYVEFNTGKQYGYPQCPQQKYRALLAAHKDPKGSVGRTFHLQVLTVQAAVALVTPDYPLPN